MSADTLIVDSFIQLTNYFASKFGQHTESIGRLTELWERQGSMIATMLQCDTKEFETSDLFYDVLRRKLHMMNGSLAEALDPKKAAAGDTLEICKFYSIYLEYLRKDHSAMLISVLENLASQSGFNCNVLLETFEVFDKLYAENTSDDWWTCLIGDVEEEPELDAGFRTPRRSNVPAMGFTTPANTARRFRTATSTSCRSPIADKTDSPQMRFKRCEEQLKNLQRRHRETEQMAEDLEGDNRVLKDENRKHKIVIENLKCELTKHRETAEDAEQRAQDVTALLEEKETEVVSLSRQLEESRTLVRSQQRLLEEMEVEKEKNSSKLTKATTDLEKCMKELRKTRDTNEQEFDGYRQKERELTEQLRLAMEQNTEMAEHLTTLESLKTNLNMENERLNRELEDVSLSSARSKQDVDNLKTQMFEERERHQAQMEKIQMEKSERIRMADETNERLQGELNELTRQKNELNRLLTELNEKTLNEDRSVHGQNEQIQNVRTLLESARDRIERLESELRSKNETIQVQKSQIEQAKEILATEQLIRERNQETTNNRFKELDEEMTLIRKQVDEKTQQIDLMTSQHSEELALRDEEIKACREEIRLITEEFEKMKTLSVETGDENVYMKERIKLIENDFSKLHQTRRCSSPDSLLDFLANDGEQKTEEELRKIVEQTPRKSVAFSVDLNGEDTFKGTPIGFKFEPRESMCSMDFDRMSTARSSIRSDTLTIASSKDFKHPATPSNQTSRDRVRILAERNQKVLPHLQSSYHPEVGQVDSPSADEENVRYGGGKTKDTLPTSAQKPKKKRRDSILSTIGFGKKNNNQ